MLLFCFWPPVHVACLNIEVLVFQPRTGTAMNLGSVDNYTFYSNYPAPTFSTNFLDIFISPLYPNAPPSLAFFVVAPLCCNQSPSPPGSKHRPPVSRLHPPAIILHRSSMRPVPYACVCHRFPLLCASPLSPLGLIPGPCQPLGGSPVAGPYTPLFPCLALPD